MKKIFTILCALFISSFSFADEKNIEIITFYNRYSGQIKSYALNSNGSLKNIIQDKYWLTNRTNIEVKNISSSGPRHILLSSKPKIGKNDPKISIFRFSLYSGVKEELWSLKDDYTDIRYFISGGKQYYFVSEYAKSGKYAVYEMDYKTAKPGERITKGSSWKKWTYFDFAHYKDKTYMIRYSNRSGNLVINEMKSNGKIGKQVKNTKIDKGWTTFSFYKVKDERFLLRSNTLTGRTVINKIGKKLSFGKKIYENEFSKGWKMIEPSFNGEKRKHDQFYFLNRRDDRFVVRAIKDNGKIGDVSYNSNKLQKAWTDMDVTGGVINTSSIKKSSNTFTNNPGKKAKAKKRASLIVFYTDDKPTWKIMQRIQVQEEYAIKNYDYSVLLSNKKYKAKPKPSKKVKATEANFFKHLKELAAKGYYIDLYIIAHGSRTSLVLQKTKNKYTPSYNGFITAKEIVDRLEPIYGKGKFPIRMVFMSNCWGGSAFSQAFIDVGAKTVAGSRYVNFLVSKFTPFAKAWQNGDSFSKAIKASHANDERDKGLLWIDAKFSFNKWKNCKKITNVISQKGSCVRNYYLKRWSTWNDEWLYDLTGGGNIHFSSDSFIVGDKNMTKYKKPTW